MLANMSLDMFSHPAKEIRGFWHAVCFVQLIGCRQAGFAQHSLSSTYCSFDLDVITVRHCVSLETAAFWGSKDDGWTPLQVHKHTE